jgi:hypothetical protein
LELCQDTGKTCCNYSYSLNEKSISSSLGWDVRQPATASATATTAAAAAASGSCAAAPAAAAAQLAAGEAGEGPAGVPQGGDTQEGACRTGQVKIRYFITFYAYFFLFITF